MKLKSLLNQTNVVEHGLKNGESKKIQTNDILLTRQRIKWLTSQDMDR